MGFGAALWRHEAPALLVGIVGLLMARVFVLGAPVIADVYGYQSNPAATWMHRVVVGRASLHLSFLGSHTAAAIGLALAAAAVVIVLVRRSLVFTVAVVAACAVMGLVAGNWALKKFVNAAGRPDLTAAQVTWLDRAAGDERVGLIDFEPDPAPGGQFYAIWRDVELFNPQIDTRIDYGSNAATICCGHGLRFIRLRVDPTTGRISSAQPLPKLLASINAISPYGLPLKEVAASTYLPVRVSLGRLTSPFVRYAVVAGDLGGHLSEQPIVMRVYRPQRTTCAFLTTDPPDAVRVGTKHGRLTPRAGAVALGRFAGRPYVDLSLTGTAPARLTVQDAGECPTQ